MPNKFSVLVILTCSHLNPVFAEPIRFIEKPTIYISDTSILEVNQDAQTTLESFVRNWSQFELLIDKNLFPIKPPNCRKTIQIRFKGIEPIKNQISPAQQSRWELLERLRKSNVQDTSPVFLQIDTRQYMKKLADGKYTLDYCNVFVE